MLTLFLRKDIARARVLADDLDRYSEQLHYTMDLGKQRYLPALATPKGLLLCFGAGVAVSLVAQHAGREQKSGSSALGTLLNLARQSL
ncbi:hypothetical protein F6455_13785 [Proteobacteria bacterium 005FR1]|nr:hypothetical protein [Proteobacteria bacterium 005FR1]